jgi:hypothetical protein
MTPDVGSLRAALVEATRVVVEKDHVYREVGKIVAVDVERIEFTPDAVLAALAPVAEPVTPDVALTDSIRRRLRERIGDGSIRAFAREAGMSFNVLSRFLRGSDITGRNLDIVDSYLAALSKAREET